MTVGISLNNGLEAIVITDVRVSNEATYRQSDSVNKMGEFGGGEASAHYEGVIFGTGDANQVMGAIRNLGTIGGKDLDDFVKTLAEGYKSKLDTELNRGLISQKADLDVRASVVSEENRKKYVESETNEMLHKYREIAYNLRRTRFAISAFDKKSGKIRTFGVSGNAFAEDFSPRQEIGSGSDGTDTYLNSKLQGIDSSKLKPHEIAFFAMNAYCYSNQNMGVGGTPKIARISEGGVRIIPSERVVAMANLSGAYLAEIGGLSQKKVIGYFRRLLDEKRPVDYSKIAKALHLDERTLREMYIPYSSWQEESNRRLMSKGKR